MLTDKQVENKAAYLLACAIRAQVDKEYDMSIGYATGVTRGEGYTSAYTMSLATVTDLSYNDAAAVLNTTGDAILRAFLTMKELVRDKNAECSTKE